MESSNSPSDSRFWIAGSLEVGENLEFGASHTEDPRFEYTGSSDPKSKILKS
jgi:hypothetical protein